MRTPLLLAAAAATIFAAASPVAARGGGTRLRATLTGGAEVPGPGDSKGRGSATVQLNSGQNRVCYTLNVSGMQGATMAHIHRGGATDSGPPVVTLRTPTRGSSSGCAHASRALVKDIRSNPSGFYVNVHSDAYKDGAVRGQLHR